MTWVRFEDITPEHPKLAALGSYAPLCGWLWFSAACYAMRHLTDGHVSIETLRSLWPYRHIDVATSGILTELNGHPLAEFGEDPTADDLVTRLVEVELFDDLGGGKYRVHDLLDYNPSKREVLEVRRNKRKAGQAGGQARARRLLGKYPAPQPQPLEKDNARSIETTTPLGAPTAKRRAVLADSDFIAELRTNPAYTELNFERELGKFQAWFLTPRGRGKQPTRGRLVAWLNRTLEDVPLRAGGEEEPYGVER